MTKTLTLDEILRLVVLGSGGIAIQRHGEDGLSRYDAKQAILQWVADEVVKKNAIENMSHQYPIEKEVRYEVADEQRQILKDHGWKGDGQ